MNREDIIRMAREADKWSQTITWSSDPKYGGRPVSDLFNEKFAELVAAHEREECAQMLERTDLSALKNDIGLQVWFGKMFMGFAEAIRARGEK